MAFQTEPDSSPMLGIFATEAEHIPRRDQLAEQVQLAVVESEPRELAPGQFVLVIEADSSLSLHFTGRGAPSPIRVDFLSGAAAHRRQFGGGKGQLIAKAVGIKQRFRPHILDLTAGLGQDAFVLATLGCQMTLVERVDVVFQLLQDGLLRARCEADREVGGELQAILGKMTLLNQNALDYLKQFDASENQGAVADVIYLDPMFPEREKTAKVKKSMAAFHSIVGDDNDAGELLAMALNKAKYRVVIKRPRKALSLAQQYPDLSLPQASLVLEGKSSRYDIYPIAKMPD